MIVQDHMVLSKLDAGVSWAWLMPGEVAPCEFQLLAQVSRWKEAGRLRFALLNQMSILSFKRRPTVMEQFSDEKVEPAFDEVRLKAQDDRAWKAVYNEYFPRIRRHIAYMTHEAEVAEDLAQDVFVQAMKSIDSFEHRSSLSTWLFAIANRLVYKHWRKSGRKDRAYKKVAQVPTDGSGEDPARDYLSTQRAQALREVLTRLPDTLREAFVLVDVQRVNSQEAATRLGITAGNLAVRASRARAKIREELEKDGWIEATAKPSKEKPS